MPLLKDELEEGGEVPMVEVGVPIGNPMFRSGWQVAPVVMMPAVAMMPVYIPPMVAPPVEFSYTY